MCNNINEKISQFWVGKTNATLSQHSAGKRLLSAVKRKFIANCLRQDTLRLVEKNPTIHGKPAKYDLQGLTRYNFSVRLFRPGVCNVVSMQINIKLDYKWYDYLWCELTYPFWTRNGINFRTRSALSHNFNHYFYYCIFWLTLWFFYISFLWKAPELVVRYF